MGSNTQQTTSAADKQPSDVASSADVCARPLGRVRARLMFTCGVIVLVALHTLAFIALDWMTVVYGVVFGGALLGVWLWTDGTRRLVAITIAAVVSVAAREMLLPFLEGPRQVVGLGVGILLGVLDVREFEFWRRLRASQRVVAWPRWRVFRPSVYVRLLMMGPPLLALGFLGWRYYVHVRHERLVAAIDEYGGVTQESPAPKWWKQLGLGWTYTELDQVRIAPPGVVVAEDLATSQSSALTPLATSDQVVDDDVIDDLVRRIGRSTGLRFLTLANPDVTDEAFSTYNQVRNLREAWISCPRATDQGLQFLGSQPSIEVLDLTGTAVSGSFLSQGTGLPRLRILKLQGTHFDDEASTNLPQLRALKTLDLGSTSITDAALVHIGQSMALQVLDLSETAVTDAGLQHLVGQPLLILDLDGCEVSIEGIVPVCLATSLSHLSVAGVDLSTGDFSQLSSVHVLNLQGATLGSSALKELAGLNTLYQLDLSETNIGDADVESLRRFPHFGSIVVAAPTPETQARGTAVAGQPGMRRLPFGTLSLRGTQITDQSLAVIGTLKYLRSIDISETDVTDGGVRHLADMPHLDTLNLSGTKITDATLDLLGTFENLRYLHLANTSVTDAGLKKLNACKHLRSVDLTGTQVTDEGVARIREMNENVWISR